VRATSDKNSIGFSLSRYLPRILAVIFGVISLALLIAGGSMLSSGGAVGIALVSVGGIFLLVTIGVIVWAVRRYKQENNTPVRL